MDAMNTNDTPLGATPLTEDALARAMGPDLDPTPPGVADKKLYNDADLPPQAKVFWSPPDQPWPEEHQEDIEIIGACVVRAETSSKSNQVVLSCVVASSEKLTLIRFRIANHSRLARQFFKKGGMKQVPRQDGEVTVNGGAYFIQVAGTIIGEDTVPESAEAVERALVLADVDARPISV